MKRVSLNNSREEINEQDFYVKSEVTTSVIIKVRASSFEEAVKIVEGGYISRGDVVRSSAEREFIDVTEHYPIQVNTLFVGGD